MVGIDVLNVPGAAPTLTRRGIYGLVFQRASTGSGRQGGTGIGTQNSILSQALCQ